MVNVCVCVCVSACARARVHVIYYCLKNEREQARLLFVQKIMTR